MGETSHSLEEEKVEQRMGDKESNTDLEQLVAARTKELATLNAIAATSRWFLRASWRGSWCLTSAVIATTSLYGKVVDLMQNG